jgi:ATP-binding cassette, subfamily B, multidrug efflux pump
MHGLGGGGPRHLMEQEASKPKDVGNTLRRLVSMFKPYWLILIAVLALIIGSTYTQVLMPQLTGQAVDCFLTPGAVQEFALPIPGQVQQASASTCWFMKLPTNAAQADYIRGLGSLALLILGIYIAGSIMSGLMFYCMTWTGQHVLRNLRVQVFNHLHKLSLNFYAENDAGSVMSRITNDMDTIQQAVSFVLVSVFSGSLLILWIAYQMLAMNLVYALISLSVVPIMAVVTVYFSGLARKAFRRTRVEIGKVNANLEESISGVREVQAFGREDANIETFRLANASNRDANIRAVSFTAALAPSLEALGYLAIAIVTIVGGLSLLRGTNLLGPAVSLGLIITFLQYVQRFNQPVQQIATLWTNLQSAVAGAERIFGLLDAVPDVTDKPNALVMPAIQGRVEFAGVRQAYKADEPVLCDVSFIAEPGQTVAIVGPTGAGKTTIINLIPRFYDVTAGAVRIDGHDVRDVTRASLRAQIGIVLQDTYLFSDTVMNNIRFGRPAATDEEVLAAARLARADDFIQRLPDGYNTPLGERGSGLSQGQRQLISIARAALADPRILILDEATSSVDTRTERQIQQALDLLMRGRTSFVIAHRLSTIRRADQILVLIDGEIVERGRHEELLAQQGAYYDLYMSQFLNAPGGPPTDGAVSGNGHEPAAVPAAA